MVNCSEFVETGGLRAKVSSTASLHTEEIWTAEKPKGPNPIGERRPLASSADPLTRASMEIIHAQHDETEKGQQL